MRKHVQKVINVGCFVVGQAMILCMFTSWLQLAACTKDEQEAFARGLVVGSKETRDLVRKDAEDLAAEKRAHCLDKAGYKYERCVDKCSRRYSGEHMNEFFECRGTCDSDRDSCL